MEGASLLAMLLSPLLFKLLCRSINCFTKEAWFADSYESEVDGRFLNKPRELIFLLATKK